MDAYLIAFSIYSAITGAIISSIAFISVTSVDKDRLGNAMEHRGVARLCGAVDLERSTTNIVICVILIIFVRSLVVEWLIGAIVDDFVLLVDHLGAGGDHSAAANEDWNSNAHNREWST